MVTVRTWEDDDAELQLVSPFSFPSGSPS
jgi:hypothetical protein